MQVALPWRKKERQRAKVYTAQKSVVVAGGERRRVFGGLDARAGW